MARSGGGEGGALGLLGRGLGGEEALAVLAHAGSHHLQVAGGGEANAIGGEVHDARPPLIGVVGAVPHAHPVPYVLDSTEHQERDVGVVQLAAQEPVQPGVDVDLDVPLLQPEQPDVVKDHRSVAGADAELPQVPLDEPTGPAGPNLSRAVPQDAVGEGDVQLVGEADLDAAGELSGGGGAGDGLQVLPGDARRSAVDLGPDPIGGERAEVLGGDQPDQQ